jgi:hypothetical protein
VGSAPGKPQNPNWIVADCDALLQLLMTDNAVLLRRIQHDYGVQAIITEAVEAELRSIIGRRFKELSHALAKALSSGALAVMDNSFLVNQKGQEGVALYARVNELGAELYNIVDRGEAYSHAAAVILDVPVMSNDITAIDKLIAEGKLLSRPLLRAFDIVAFGLQAGYIELADCDEARQKLVEKKEFVPGCFRSCNFVTGMQVFFARILDRDRPIVGAAAPIHRNDQRIWLSRQ